MSTRQRWRAETQGRGWNRVWRKKERKKGEIRGGQIARDRARARESVRVWRMKVSKVEGRSSALWGRTPVTNDQETPGDEAQVKKTKE